MLKDLRIATFMLVVLTLVTGLIYPLLVTGLAQLVFRHQANGSLVVVADRPVGSELVGQEFTRPEYFWGRLSATAPAAYNAAASSGSNLGPMNPALFEAASARIAALKQYDVPGGEIPVDLVTSSASGLDPEISLAAAEYQVPRIAKARGLTEEALRRLVAESAVGRQFGLLGEPRVNVLRLNLSLDGQPEAR
jgi:K+-transporting ATPase ATPase C chain